MKTVKILGKTWKVKNATTKEMAEIGVSNTIYNMGLCSIIDKTIFLYEHLNKEQYEDILTHELTHAILYESSLQHHLSDEQQEQYCEFMKFARPIINEIVSKVKVDK